MITQKELKRHLFYSPTTGRFIRIYSPNRKGLGQVAGYHVWRGHRDVNIDGKAYREHVLAWLYVHGEVPGPLVHINGDKADNRLENLQLRGKG